MHACECVALEVQDPGDPASPAFSKLFHRLSPAGELAGLGTSCHPVEYRTSTFFASGQHPVWQLCWLAAAPEHLEVSERVRC